MPPWRWLRRFARKLSSLRIGHQLGLVITDNSARLCLVKQILFRRRVIDTTIYPLDPQETTSWPRRVDAAIKAVMGYLDERHLSRTTVNVGLVGDDIAFRRMYLPRMSKKELTSAITWEGQKLFPFDFEQCLVNHDVAEVRQKGEYQQIGVNLVAIKREIVETLFDRMESAGLPVGHVDFLPAVIAMAFSDRVSSDDSVRRLLLHLDDDQSLAVFMHGGRLKFFQQFVTNPISTDDGRMMNAAAMAAELTTFLDLFKGQQSGNSVDEVIMAGKYAADPDVPEIFAANIGLPCRRFSEAGQIPTSCQSVDDSDAEAMFDVIAAGLADTRRHPLIPDRTWRKIERKKTILRLATAATLVLLLLGNFHAQSLLMNRHLRSELESARSSSQAIENSAAYHAYLSLLGEMNRRQNRQTQMQSRHPSHLHLLLKELSRTIPDNISLTTMEFSSKNNPPRLRLEGVVSLSGFSPEIVLAQYVDALGKSPFFDNVIIERHIKKRDNGRFDLTFVLEMGARI